MFALVEVESVKREWKKAGLRVQLLARLTQCEQAFAGVPGSQAKWSFVGRTYS